MRRSLAVFTASLAGAVLLGAGCSNNRESPQAAAPRDTGSAAATVAGDGVQEITIAGNEQFRFVPSTVRARPGKLRIILTNSGTTPHNLQVEGTGQTTVLVSAGERARITVDLRAGRHPFVCTLHIRLHMMGTIVVS